MAGSQAAVLKQRPQKVEPKLIPPRGARPVDVFDDGSATGAIVYEMEVIDFAAMKAAKKQAKDPVTGEPLYRRNNAGQPIVPVMRLPKPIKRKKVFILRSYKTGQVRMIENFRPDPAKVAEKRERAQVAAFAEDLAKEAIRRGYESAAEMLGALLGDAEPDAEDQATIAEADSLVESGGDALFDEVDYEPVDDEKLTVEADPNFDAEAFRERQRAMLDEEGPEPAAFAETDARCEATTVKGEPCKRPAIGETGRCSVHQDK